jgi:Fe-S-cluster containining protein
VEIPNTCLDDHRVKSTMAALITDLNQIKHLAAQRHDEFEIMRYLLELDDDRTDAEIDAMVDEIAAPIIAGIDCTQCANCCRSLDVYLTENDVQHLADGIHIPVEDVIGHHIDTELAAQVDEWGKFRTHPCAFLQGNLCSVYAHRPESCRLYPAFTPDFRWTLSDMIGGAGMCPIIYNVLAAVSAVIDQRYESPSKK